MSLICQIATHSAPEAGVRNQGLEFGACRRCGRDLLRTGRTWKRVPRGFRVVWRRPAPVPGSAAQLLFDLPCAGHALAIVPAPSPPRRRVAEAADLAGLALRAFAWLVADRLRRWLRTLRRPRAAHAPQRALPAR